MLRLLSLLLGALVTVSAITLAPLHADNCLSCRRAAVTVAAVPVTTAVTTAVIATPVVQQTLVIPQAVRVETVAPSYYSGGAAYRDALLADAIAYRTIIRQAQEKAAAPQTPGQPAPAVAAVPTSPTTVPEKLAGIVNTRCAGCHANGRNKVDFGDLATTPTATRLKVFYFVMAGHMPQKIDGTPEPLPDEELQPFADWVGVAVAPNRVAKRGI